MKTARQKQQTILSTCAAVAAVALAGTSIARADLALATFDTDISANDGIPSNATATWDGTQNGPNGPAGGSEHVVVSFTDQGTAWQQSQFNFTQSGWPGTDVPSYINVEWDIKVDIAHSHLGPNGNYGEVHPILQSWSDGSPGWDDLGGIQITNTSGWQHMKMSVAGFSGHMTRFVFALISNGGNNVTNTCSYWIDNIVLTSPPLPPPTLGTLMPAPKQPGLTLLPATVSQWQRVMVYPNTTAVGTGNGWYGQATAGNPVSYSFTITNFPALGHYGAQVFWIPVNAMQYAPSDTSVDWNCTNDMVLTINGSANAGMATGWGVSLSCKTNLPGSLGNGNPNLVITNFSYGTLPVGTWTVTFTDNSDLTITCPDGSTHQTSIQADWLNMITGNALGDTAMVVYFGIQPNDPQGIGFPTVFSNIKITGVPTPVNDNFNLGYLDTTNVWSILSDSRSDVTVNSGNLVWYLDWNTPNDQGYASLLATPALGGLWNDLEPSSSWLFVNGKHRATITSTDLAANSITNTAFFRLIKRQFTQLQVLLPGETNAPNTLTGKTGTPTTGLTTTDLVNVTINAVDSTFHIVSSSDALSMSSSDGGAVFVNGTPSLINGIATAQVYLESGTWTITATDSANNAIPDGISSSIVIQ